MHADEKTYVSRAGLKLHHALHTFGVDPRGLVCADFGCNVGGFTDCLLKHHAGRVFALDTGYGTLAWTLRNDPRVVVMERTNALHALPPSSRGGTTEAATPISLVVIDMGWTPQRLCIPAALKWLASTMPGSTSSPRIITLVKPHYEVRPDEKHLLRDGVLEEQVSERIAERVRADFPSLGVRVTGWTRSPIVGGASKGGSKSGRSKSGSSPRGNIEYLALLEPVAPTPPAPTLLRAASNPPLTASSDR